MLIDSAKDLGWAPSNYFSSLQAWLDSGEQLLFLTPGVHDVPAGLTCATPNVRITGPGVLRATTAEVDVLTLTGDDQTVDGLRIDGNMLGRYGVHATGARSSISDCRIWDLKSLTGSPRGIYTSNPGGTTIRRNRITNIHGPGNTTQGDSNGMVRGIVAHSPTATTGPSIIEGNVIDGLNGEETDGIAILYSDTVTDPYLSGYTLISGNQIRNAGRRYIKLQGSDIVVDRNWCWSTPDYAPVNPSAVIDIVQGQRIQITNNRLEERGQTAPILITGPSATTTIDDVTVRGNWMRETEGTSPVLYAVYATNLVIDSNTMIGGQFYVSAASVTNITVTNNVCRDGSGATAFNFTASVTGKANDNNVPANKRALTGTNVSFERNA